MDMQAIIKISGNAVRQVQTPSGELDAMKVSFPRLITAIEERKEKKINCFLPCYPYAPSLLSLGVVSQYLHTDHYWALDIHNQNCKCKTCSS